MLSTSCSSNELDGIVIPTSIAPSSKPSADLARLIMESGGLLAGAKVMELGTGWLPLTAIGFWICGAEEVHTVDVNRHFLPSVFSKALRWMMQNEAELVALWDGIASADRVAQCLP